MKSNQNAARMGFGIVALGVMALSGCAKDRPYKEIFKPQVTGKNLVSTTEEYLYVTSMLDGKHSTDGVMPGEMGDERIVRFRFTEKELLAETTELDPRFKSNPVNGTPVMAIPVTHLEYRCAENGAGECSNKEEENKDIDWQQKRFFLPDVQNFKPLELSALDHELAMYFGMGKCLVEVGGARVVDFKTDENSLLLTVERTYQKQPACAEIRELFELPNLTFNMRQVYSFVKRSSVVSKDYQTVQYPDEDQDTFGFFETQQLRLSQDLRDLETSLTSVMERWNPKRKIIRYGLTQNFAKPENRHLLDATIEAVRAVNNAFGAAGVDLRIELEAPSDKNIGDLRNSMIVLVEDPMDHGTLGYGPAVADPITGEIISARTVMYLGNLISNLQVDWDEYVAFHGRTAPAKEGEAKPAGNTATGAVSALSSRLAKELGAKAKLGLKTSELFKRPELKKDIAHGAKHIAANAAAISKLKSQLKKARYDGKFEQKLALSLADDTVEGDVLRYRYGLNLLSKKCFYPADYMNFNGAIKASLDGLKDIPKVPYAQLTEQERAAVMKVLVPYVYVPTLVHELGHNMGLRHNFKGSEDAENFYSEEEVSKFGHAVPMKASSIMDYGYNPFNQLRVMGKYDVAAFRYGYRREVEKTDGTVLALQDSLETLPETDKKHIKSYGYCTDENVGPNPGCRRFDEGTSNLEIAQHMLRMYNRYYTIRNFRNGRRNFSDTTDASNAFRRLMGFYDLRPFLDTYERIRVEFGIPENHEIWKQNEFLKDLEASYHAAMEMFLEPLKTPTASCIVGVQGSLVDVPLAALSSGIVSSCSSPGSYYPSCFHPDLVACMAESKLEMVAEFGKEVQNQKFMTNPNAYADQIDVRGNWPDKIAGLMLALTRETGSKVFDSVKSNAFDINSESRKKILTLVDGILLNRVETKAVARLADGKTEVFSYLMRPHETQRIPHVESRNLRRLFGLPDRSAPLSEVVLSTFLREMWSDEATPFYHLVRDHYGIYRETKDFVLPGDKIGINLDGMPAGEELGTIVVNGTPYYFHLERNGFAAQVRVMIQIAQLMEKVIAEAEARQVKPEERVALVMAAAKARESQPAGTSPAGLTPAEEAASQLPSEAIKAFVDGEIESSQYLFELTETLYKANVSADHAISERNRP